MVPAACDVGGKMKSLFSSPSFIPVTFPYSMSTDGVRAFAPRKRGLSGDFCGGVVNEGDLADTLGVRGKSGGEGLGGGRSGVGVIPLAM